MKQIEREMRTQKHLIKRSVGNTVIVEAAEIELRALQTRLTVLKGNSSKFEPPKPQGPNP